MFDPKKFSVAKKRTIYLGTSEHPVLEHVVGTCFKLVPSKLEQFNDLFYLEINNSKGIITLHDIPDYASLQFHELTLAEFKAKVVAGERFENDHEVVNLNKLNKHVGNDVMDMLYCEGVINRD